jgi:hypothetical protein
LAFGLTGFFAVLCAGSVEDDEVEDDDDGERFFIGSLFRAFTGLRLGLGDCDGERRRSRRSDVDLEFILGLS